ncbi:helix-turn-helix domain-containing protein [Novibacillus thermophilus]|uniref:Transcriptional regulator n=1 Tax=Novibacillus thermophilus TaxID=1471761 RepID=A0A1U9KAF3_9BACL|nr:helix-turn-helix transcriptional regulator [Novibacillus thermophilus]AQS57024.1 transcriptional regulator [Novibacillus thermophilus]
MVVKLIDLDFIKSRRLIFNLTLNDMAKEFGFKSPSTYLKYEKGVYSFKAEHLPILCKVLHCNMNDLFLEKMLLK